MNSYLITGGHYQERIKKARKIAGFWQPHPDLLMIKAELSVGIKQIREGQKFLSRRPYQGKIKVVVILEAEKMTLPSQNAFLKTLEEPPANSLIILSAPSHDDLLATVISRCQLIKLKPQSQIKLKKSLITHHSSLIAQWLKSSAGQQLELIEPYTKSREEAIRFCREMIAILRKYLTKEKRLSKLSMDDNQLLAAIKNFQQSFSLLQANINVKLVLENLVLAFNNQSKNPL
jgi:DNA polymerase III gamma/tau subunit